MDAGGVEAGTRERVERRHLAGDALAAKPATVRPLRADVAVAVDRRQRHVPRPCPRDADGGRAPRDEAAEAGRERASVDHNGGRCPPELRTPPTQSSGWMEPTVQRGILWGIVSSLLFVVLLLGYRLITSVVVVSLPVLIGGGVGVGVVTAGLSYAIDTRLG